MTLLQLLLLFLSAFRHMETSRYDDYDDVSDESSLFYQYRRRSPDVRCQDQEKIASWISEQELRNAKLTSFNRHLAKFLDLLNGNGTTDALEDHCCFYEKYTMTKLFTDITELSEKNGFGVGEPLKSSGEMGQDLDNILARMRQLVGNEINNCCKQLKLNFKEMEDDLLRQMDELQQKLKATNVESTSQATDIREKLVEQEKKLNELKEHIKKLKQQQKTSENNVAHCCEELETKLNELTKQMETAKTKAENKATEMEKELKELQAKQKEQENSINGLKADLEKRTENVQKVVENCEEKCGTKANESNGKNVNDNNTKDSEKYEQIMKEFTEKLNKESDSKYQQFLDNLKSVENLLKKLQDQNDPNNFDTKHCSDVEALKNLEMEMAKKCYKNITNLAEDGDKMHQAIIQLNDSYSDHISQLNADIKDLENRLNEALGKRQSSEGSTQIVSGNNETLDASGKRIKQLEDQIKAINQQLQAVQTDLNDTDNKLAKLKEILAKSLEEFNNQKKATEEQKKQQDQNKEPQLKPNDLAKRWENLEKIYAELRKELDNILQLEKRIEELEKQLKESLEKLNEMKAKVAECSNKFQALNIDDMVNRLKNLEEINLPKPYAIGPKRPKIKRNESAIGGIDFH